jgi:hypothetical protein
MVYYSVHNRYNFLWQTQVTNVLQYSKYMCNLVLKFFDFSGWMNQFPNLLLPLGVFSNNSNYFRYIHLVHYVAYNNS